MNAKCETCEYTPEDRSKAVRRTMAECENCSRTICEDCLRVMAVEEGWLSEQDADLIRDAHGADGFLRKCETTRARMCPECFE